MLACEIRNLSERSCVLLDGHIDLDVASSHDGLHKYSFHRVYYSPCVLCENESPCEGLYALEGFFLGSFLSFGFSDFAVGEI